MVDSKEIYNKTTRHFLAPVLELLDDPKCSEVMINGPGTIFFERGGKVYPYEKRAFSSPAALMAAARNIAEFCNRTLDRGVHAFDGRLPDGSRVHVILPPSSRGGICITIRKFRKANFTLETFVEFGSLSSEAAEYLAIVVCLHKNLVVAGGTGTGKTSLLNGLSTAIPATERIVVIEDTSELQLQQPHVVYLEAQPPSPDGIRAITIRDLFVDSLRMRPDRIVVGEVRRGEALDLIQSMLSGHDGSLSTVHASTPRDAAVRLETLCLMSDVALPANVARAQVASAIQAVVQLSRFRDGSRKVTTISECQGLDKNGDYRFLPIFEFKPEGIDPEGKILGSLRWTGNQSTYRDEIIPMGMESLIRLSNKIWQVTPLDVR
jgi:pilus assembly protein CpaF